MNCTKFSLDTLSAPVGSNQAFRLCRNPETTGPLPLHLFAHGDGSIGSLTEGYDDYINYFTDGGFVVAEYLSCGLDWACGVKGDEDFLEMLKIASYLSESGDENVDFEFGISSSGHSSGARAALMIAAARDTDDYLPSRISQKITPSMGLMLDRAFCNGEDVCPSREGSVIHQQC